MRITVASLVLALLPLSATADLLNLCNGDRITGDIQSIRDGVITVTTAYAGDLAVQQSEVCSLETDEPWFITDTENTQKQAPLSDVEVAAIVVAATTEEGLAPPAPEEPEEEKKERLWTGNIDTGLAIKSGATDSTNFSLGFTLTRTRPQHVLTLTGTGLYGEVESEINNRRWLGEAKWKYYPRDRWYAFGLGSLEHDAGRKLDFRWTVGTGLGYDVWESDKTSWALEAGLNYSKEWWNRYTPAELDRARSNAAAARNNRIRSFLNDLPSTGISVDSALRLARDINGLQIDQETTEEDDIVVRLHSHLERKFFKTSTLTHDVTLLPEPTDWEDYRVLSDLLWTTPINDHLSLRINLKTEYDNDPGQDGTDEWDNLLQTGLRYEF